MLTYNSILITIVIEGLVKSYVIPTAMDKHKLNENGVFYLSLMILAVFSVFEFFFFSRCMNTELLGDITEQNALGKLFLLLVVSLIVNYRWFIKIYNKFQFWTTIGILFVVGFVNEFNNIIINNVLQNVTGTECSNL